VPAPPRSCHPLLAATHLVAPRRAANTLCRDKLTVCSGGHQLILMPTGRNSRTLREWARLINEQVTGAAALADLLESSASLPLVCCS